METRCRRRVGRGECRAQIRERRVQPKLLCRCQPREHHRAAIFWIGFAADEALLDEPLDQLADPGGAQLEMLREQTRAQRLRAEDEQQAAALRRTETALLRGAPREPAEMRRDRQEATRELERLHRAITPHF